MEESVKELLTLGRGCFERKQYALAEQYLSQAMRENQPFADVCNMLGVIYHDQGNLMRAQGAFKSALEINPAYTEAALNLAIIYNDAGKYDEAREVYKAAIESREQQPGKLDWHVKGKIANLYADIGDAYSSNGHFAEAISEYERALQLSPSFVDIRVKLGAALRDSGEKEAALAQFGRVVEEAPSFIPARIHLGVTLFSLGRVDDAVAQWREVVGRDPSNKKAQMYLALVRDTHSKSA